MTFSVQTMSTHTSGARLRVRFSETLEARNELG